MKIVFLACAQSVIVDRFSNELSLYSVIEGLSATAFPLFVPRFALVATLDRGETDAADAKVHVTVRQGDHVLYDEQGNVDFKVTPRARQICVMHGLPVVRAIPLEIEVDAAGVKGHLTIPVEKVSVDESLFAENTAPEEKASS